MGNFFKNGRSFPRLNSEVKLLIGKKIEYVLERDIDKSGRGYWSRSWGTIQEVIGKNVSIDGNWLSFKQIREYNIIEE